LTGGGGTRTGEREKESPAKAVKNDKNPEERTEKKMRAEKSEPIRAFAKYGRRRRKSGGGVGRGTPVRPWIHRN